MAPVPSRSPAVDPGMRRLRRAIVSMELPAVEKLAEEQKLLRRRSSSEPARGAETVRRSQRSSGSAWSVVSVVTIGASSG